MPDRMRFLADQRVRDLRALGYGDNEHPLSRLRNEMPRVQDNGTGAHSQAVESGYDGFKFLAAVDGEKPDDVFQNHDARKAAVRFQTLHEIDEGPERSRAGTVPAGRLTQTKAVARRRQVLTRKRRPGEVRTTSQIVGVDLVDV